MFSSSLIRNINNGKRLLFSHKSLHTSTIYKCGMLAYLKQQQVSDNISQEAVASGLKRLHHRGPDHSGSWMNYDKSVCLGHTRLSIIDLSPTGNQPLPTLDGMVHVVVNGELYDFENIRSDLISKGHEFLTQSDSEIVLHLYNEYGPAFVDHLRGEFALCLWDEKRQVFIAARDRFGIKPMYFSQHNGHLMVASEIKALLALGVPAEWNVECVANMGYFYHPSDTIFKGIYQVPPGHYIIASKLGSCKLIPYWDFRFPSKEQDMNMLQFPQYSEQNVIKEVRHKLMNAVQLRLRADVPVGFYLSGGLDSCTVLGMSAHLYPNKSMNAFTISFFEHERFDELKLAEEMAQKVNANMNVLNVDSSLLADHIESSIYHYEVPLANPHATAKYLLSDLVRKRGLKVVLTGEGSDEIFGGYSFFRQDYVNYSDQFQSLSHNEKHQMIQALRNNNVMPVVNEEDEHNIDDSSIDCYPSKLAATVCKQILGFYPALLRTLPPNIFVPYLSYDVKHRHHYPAHHPAHDIDPMFYNLSALSGEKTYLMRHHWNILNSSLYLQNKTMLANMILNLLGDRSEMAHSVEGRVPFLDHHLVEYVTNLPTSYKIKGMIEKYILKEAAKPYITQNVYQRQKHPFLAPPTMTQQKSKLYEFLHQTLHSPIMKDIWWLDQSKVIYEFERMSKQIQANANMSIPEVMIADFKYFQLASLVVLQKHFGLK